MAQIFIYIVPFTQLKAYIKIFVKVNTENNAHTRGKKVILI